MQGIRDIDRRGSWVTIHRPIPQYRGEYFFRYPYPIYVNRVRESFDSLEHSHDFLEIAYVGEGSGIHHLGGESLQVVQGDIFLLPVGVSHVFRPLSTAKDRPLIVYNCVVAPEAIDRLLASFPGSGGIRAMLSRTEYRRYRDPHGEFHRLFQRLHDEYAVPRPGQEAALHLGVAELLLYLHRLETEPERAPRAGRPEMDEALRYIGSHYREPLTAGRIAGMIGIGTRQFHRLFKRQTGTTLNDYVQTARIREACRLLRATERKVADIAASVGYQDLPFFNRLFKKKTGMSPRDYRKQSRRAEEAGEPGTPASPEPHRKTDEPIPIRISSRFDGS